MKVPAASEMALTAVKYEGWRRAVECRLTLSSHDVLDEAAEESENLCLFVYSGEGGGMGGGVFRGGSCCRQSLGGGGVSDEEGRAGGSLRHSKGSRLAEESLSREEGRKWGKGGPPLLVLLLRWGLSSLDSKWERREATLS